MGKENQGKDEYDSKNLDETCIEYSGLGTDVDIKKFDHLFLVMDLVETDFKNLMENSKNI
jgi:hypothetical protein